MTRNILIAFAVLFVLSRGFVLSYSEYVYDEEEYKTGSIGKLVMDGPPLPLLEYQPGDYEGGTLFFGLMTIPFFVVLGPKYLALKAMATVTGLVLGVCLILLADRIAGDRAALVAAALYLVPVPAVVQIMSLPWGNYAETAMLTMVTLVIFHDFLFEDRGTMRRAAVLGFLWGFGTWVHYGYAVTPLACLLIWHLSTRNLLADRRLWVAIACAIAGFSPWFAYNLTHHFWGLHRISDAFDTNPEAWQKPGVLSRLADLVLSDFAAGMHFRFGRESIDRAVSYAYQGVLTAAVIAIVVAARGRLRAWGRMLYRARARLGLAERSLASMTPVVYIALYGAVYILTGYGLFAATWQGLDAENHAHIFQLYPMFILGAAVAGGLLYERVPRVVTLLTVFLVAFGAAGVFRFIDLSRPQFDRLRSNAYDRGVIYGEIGRKWARAPEEMNKWLAAVPPFARREMAYGAGTTYGLFYIDHLNVAVDKCEVLPKTWRPYCHLGIGTGVAASTRDDDALRAKALGVIPEKFLHAVEPGLVLGDIWFHLASAERLAVARMTSPPPELPWSERDPWRDFLQAHISAADAAPER
ncbi:glycosyltransferase family 39 protein [bacterium]|nr:glycosyltransferase family 39 protein [bacterium]